MSDRCTEKRDYEPEAAVEQRSRVESINQLPKGWRYRQLRLGPYKLPHIASPMFQLIHVALAFFLYVWNGSITFGESVFKLTQCYYRCPGMYNALSGLGGGGQLDANVANNATVALYSTFSVVAFFSGTVCNRLGVKTTLTLGCSG